MDLWMLFGLLGGLGLFLYGMQMMSDSLESMAGDRIRDILNVLTSNRFKAVGIGIVVTALVQSSSATTVLVVGFVNAGMMKLTQAAGVIMGSNIGTTITAQLIAFDLSAVAPIILFSGMLMTVFAKKRKYVKIGEIVLGFGMLFVGLNMMSDAMVPLRENETFRDWMVNFNNPIIGVLVGMIVTAIVQSSSASVGILQSLAIVGLVDIKTAVFIILGQNIGTCITAILASLGANANSKRASFIHFLFNFSGAALYLILVLIFPSIIDGIITLSPGSITRQIANFHTIFNVSVTILLLPFLALMVRIATKMIPEQKSRDIVEKRLMYIDEKSAQNSTLALSQILQEINRMGQISYENLKMAFESFFNQDEEKLNRVIEVEKTVDFLSDNITKYLINLKGEELSNKDLVTVGNLHHVIIDLERISDRAEDIANYTMNAFDSKTKMSSEALENLKNISERTLDILHDGLNILETFDTTRLDSLRMVKDEIEISIKDYTNGHIKRLQHGGCSPKEGVVFTNMLSALERISSHAVNIAYSTETK